MVDCLHGMEKGTCSICLHPSQARDRLRRASKRSKRERERKHEHRSSSSLTQFRGAGPVVVTAQNTGGWCAACDRMIYEGDEIVHIAGKWQHSKPEDCDALKG